MPGYLGALMPDPTRIRCRDSCSLVAERIPSDLMFSGTVGPRRRFLSARPRSDAVEAPGPFAALPTPLTARSRQDGSDAGPLYNDDLPEVTIREEDIDCVELDDSDKGEDAPPNVVPPANRFPDARASG